MDRREAEAKPPLTLVPAACCICDSVDADPVAVGEDFEYRTSRDYFLIVRCRRCGLLCLDPRPAESELERIYPPTYHAFDFSAERFGIAYWIRQRLEARRALEWCGGIGEEARILDVGCGDGFHLGLLRRFGRRGWRLEGVDASRRAVEAARRAGLEVHHGRVEDLDLPRRAYDRILLVATLEHVADPTRLLGTLGELLTPDGRLVIVTDNAATLDFRIFRRRHWGGYHFPRHTFLFSPDCLRSLAEKVNLEVEELTTQVSPVNWTYSVRNLLEDWGAPRWLVERFSLGSPVSLAAFTVIDAVQRLFVGGSLLRAVLRLADEATSGARPGQPGLQAADSANGSPWVRGLGPALMGSARSPVAIVGAGIAGLTAARELVRHNIPVRIFEGGARIAGLARSFRDEEGFTYDFGAHFITNRLAAAIGVGDTSRDVRRYGESVRVGRRSIAYPLGLLASPRFVTSAIRGRIAGWRDGRSPASAAEWFRAEYGAALAKEVAIPIVEKWSGRPAEELAASVGEKFSSLGHTIVLRLAKRATRRAIASGYCREQPESVHVWHVYPDGGVATLCERLAASLWEAIGLESRIEAIVVDRNRAVGVRVNGETIEASAVVSTVPIHVLPRLAEGVEALEAFRRFRFRPMALVNLRLEGRNLLPDVVLWTPGQEFPFFRLTEAPASMPWLAPAGKTLITVDLGCDVGDSTWEMGEEALGEYCLDALEPVIPGVRGRYLGCRVLKTPVGYPIYLREYEADRQTLQRSTGVEGLYSVGRNGRFSHDLMEDVYWRTARQTRQILAFLDGGFG